MSARRNPRWSTSEIAILRDVYVREGLDGTMRHLPDRSWHSIYVKASKLGLRCEKLPDAPRCKLSGENLEQAITLRKEGWSFARIGAKFGVAEATACNAVLNTLCIREGHTPAERHPNGRLTERGLERLRWCLKKGMKGVDIQLHLGVTASCISEQRRRYNRELKANGKAPLPPPGGGEAYSGAKIPLAKKREAERLFMEGFGTLKVSEQSGVSKTVATRIRNRLIKKLKKRGECLTGCDIDGKRRKMRDHVKHVPDELADHLRGLIMDRIPVRRAAAICGIGAQTAYRIRDQLKNDLGEAMPKPRLPGRVSKLRADMLYAQAIAPAHLWRFRQLVREHGEVEARRLLRAEITEAKRNLSFEEQLARVAAGEVRVSRAIKISPATPERTLGGISTAAIL